MEAAKAKLHVAGQQVAGTVPWIGTNSREEWQRLTHKKCQSTMALLQNVQPGGPAKLTEADDSLNILQENGWFADFWYLDDGDILCATLRWFSPDDWLWTRLTCDRSRKTSTKKRKSSTTFQIWTALLPHGKSPKSALSVDPAVHGQHHTRGRGGTTTLQSQTNP